MTDSGVVYLDQEEAQVKLVKPDATIRDHPFIKLMPSDYRVDWAVSADGGRIAWSISQKAGDGQLYSAVWLADSAGTEIKKLLDYGPRAGIRLLPVAFSADEAALYLEAHPDGIAEAKPYAWRTGLFALRLADGQIQALPSGEPCFCAVGFGQDIMLRLQPDGAGLAPAVLMQSLAGGDAVVIPALARSEYTEAGNILVNADGASAVYALSQLSGFEASAAQPQTVLVWVDLQKRQQMVINSPLAGALRPLSWTEDNSAILFTQAGGGTWKISLIDGRSQKIADAIYLGRLGRS